MLNETLHAVNAALGSEEVTVREELQRILDSTHFRASRRYPAMLKFVVEKALVGRAEELKERTIGIEVFHRDLSYDTDSDPVVRVIAGEVRKRLQQYYDVTANHRSIRIVMVPGSYVPQFVMEESLNCTASTATATEVEPSPPPQTSGLRFNRLRTSIGIAALFLCVAAVITLWWRHHDSDTAMNRMWRPILQQSVLITIGPIRALDSTKSPGVATPNLNMVEALNQYNTVPLADAISAVRITNLLAEGHQGFRILNANEINFYDLQSGPTVLIGAFNNPWTIRLTSKLRFRFQDSLEVSRILDTEATQQPEWVLYRSKPYSSLTQDYAVIARYHDTTTGKVIMVAGGIGPNGTLAASDFLTSEDYLRALYRRAPRDWGGENLEAVLRTEVINGSSGPPSIVAAKFW